MAVVRTVASQQETCSPQSLASTQSKKIRLIVDSKLPIGVNGSMVVSRCQPSD